MTEKQCERSESSAILLSSSWMDLKHFTMYFNKNTFLTETTNANNCYFKPSLQVIVISWTCSLIGQIEDLTDNQAEKQPMQFTLHLY